MRGETKSLKASTTDAPKFQSTLPVRGETGSDSDILLHLIDFNPLSPCGERHQNRRRNDANLSISIHSPRAGRDGILPGGIIAPILNFNPLSPCGERLFRLVGSGSADCISIHSPRAGRDWGKGANIASGSHFNPLSPCGERPFVERKSQQTAGISIHSPRAGRD